MKKTLILIILVLLQHYCNAQITGETLCYTASNSGTIHEVNDPTRLIAGKLTTAPSIRIILTYETNWWFEAQVGLKAAARQAADEWGNALANADPTGNMTIRIYVKPYNECPSGTGLHKDAHVYTKTTYINSIGSPGGSFGTNTYYPQALANHLYCKAGITGNYYNTGGLGGTDFVINVNACPDYKWHFNHTLTCPSDKIDFKTSFLHEIGHGLGFTTCLKAPYPHDVQRITHPHIYDRFISDNYSGCTCVHSSCTLVDVMTFGSSSAQLADFCEGQGGYNGSSCSASSNEVYFNGILGAAPRRVFTPANFKHANSSIEHPHQNQTSTGDWIYDELMQHTSTMGTQLAISTKDLNVLGTIGWEVIPPVGSAISLNNPSSSCSGAPDQVMSIGTTYNYCIGGTVLLNPSYASWNLKAYDVNGNLHTVASQTTGSTWNVNFSSLPSGYVWMRDLNGRVASILTYFGQDFSSNSYNAAISVGINYAPQDLLFKINNASEYWCLCDKTELSFWARGATSYSISKRMQLSSTGWTGWSTPITCTSNSYLFTGLSEYNNYEFQVQASNSLGTLTSSIIKRNRCKNKILVNPNPISANSATTLNIAINPYSGTGEDGDDGSSMGYADADYHSIGFDSETAPVETSVNPCGGDGTHFYITAINLVNIANSQITYSFPYNGTSHLAQLDISSIQSGVYTLTVISSGTGESVATEVEINN